MALAAILHLEIYAEWIGGIDDEDGSQIAFVPAAIEVVRSQLRCARRFFIGVKFLDES